MDLSLYDIERSIEKDGTVSFLQSHRFIATLLCSALTVNDVIKTLEGIQAIYPKCPTYEQTYLNNFRRDLTLICKIVNAIRIGWCQHIRQLGSDDSNFGTVTTSCLSIVLEEARSKELQHILLSACSIPVDKTAVEGLACVELFFKQMHDELGLFREFCLDNDVSVYNIPSPDEVTLSKLGNMSIAMSDNAPNALAKSRLIQARVRELVQANLTEEELADMTDEEKAAMCLIFVMGCIIHLRHLLVKEAISEETALLKVLCPVDNHQQDRLEASVSSVCHALVKAMSDEYEKGFSDKISVWMSTNGLGSEVLLSLGRAGNGARFDSEFEIPYKILLMKKVIMQMLVEEFIVSKFVPNSDAAATQETVIAKSIRVRLGSKQIQAAMRARAMLFYCCIAPLRMLMNSKELREERGDHEPLHLYDFGGVFDTLEKALVDAIDSPIDILQIDFRFFPIRQFPCLINFYANRNIRELQSANREKKVLEKLLVRREIYDLGSDEELLMMTLQFLGVLVRGMLDSLTRNGKTWLTSCDGQYSTQRWTPEMKEKLGSLAGDNIALGESPFGRAGYVDEKLMNALQSTINGVVVGGQCGLFEHLKDLNETQLVAILNFAKSRRTVYKEEDRLALIRQKKCKEDKLKATRERLMAKLDEKNQLRAALQCIQRVKTNNELTQALGKLDSDTKKINFLKTQIRVYTIVAGWKEEKGNDKFSKKGDVEFGGTANLTKRLRALLSSGRTFPSYGEVGPSSSDELLEDDAGRSGFTLMEDYKTHGQEIMSASTSSMRDLQKKNATYLPRDLIFCWYEVDIFKWRYPLTDVQAEYRVGRVFVDRETNEELVVRGLYYDDANDDIVIYLHLVDDLTSIEIDTGVMKPRKTQHCSHSMFREQQIAENWKVCWTGKVFKTTLSA